MMAWLHETIDEAIRETKITSRKGELRRQLHAGVRVTGRQHLNTLQGFVMTEPWIFPHEYGAHIVPKRARALTIPFAYALRPDGSLKYRNPNSWRRFGSFVLKKPGSSTGFIVYKAKNGELRYLYVLKDEASIPARLNLNRMADRELGELLTAFGRIFVQEASLDVLENPWRR